MLAMRFVLAMGLLSMAVGPAYADMWECEEPGGGKRFTNIKADAKGCASSNSKCNSD